MKKIITYGGYFEAFMSELSEQERKKINHGLLILRELDRVPVKFVKYIREGLYELRAEAHSGIFRVFFIFDEGNIIVLFNGFQKKTQKTPENEILKALKIKESYYACKRQQNP